MATMNPTLSIPKCYALRRWGIGLLLWVAGIGIAAAQQSTVIRVNAGGGAYTDSAGTAWSADTGFSNGVTQQTAVTSIGATPDPELYRTDRWLRPEQGSSLLYSANVPNGQYVIRLHFAETYGPTSVRGARVFDVLVEGALAIDNLDIFDAVGANTAYVRTVTTRVSDGQLNIAFRREVENPLVRAIEIRSVPSLASMRYRIRGSGVAAQVVDMNDSGQAVLNTRVDSPASWYVSLWNGSNIEVIPTPGGLQFAEAVAINSVGAVAMSVFDHPANPRGIAVGYLWSRSSLWGIDYARFTSLTDQGLVAGHRRINLSMVYRWSAAFASDGSYFKEFSLAPGPRECDWIPSSFAYDINQSGWAVGESDWSTCGSLGMRAFLGNRSGLIDLGTLGGSSSRAVQINDAGLIAGVSLDSWGRERVALWANGSVRDLGGLGGGQRVVDMNESGWIAGDGYNAAYQSRGFVWDGSVFREIDGGSSFRVTDIDEAGWVVGSSDGRAIIWSSEGGRWDLNLLIRSSDPLRPYVTLTDAVKINARGQILASGTDSRGIQLAFILTPADTTPPEVLSSISGTQGGGGWYRGNVTVNWTVSDPDSAITGTSGCSATTVTFDTGGATYTCTATSEGGTTSRSVTVRRDSTAPSASAAPLTSPNGAGWYAGAVTVRFTGSDGLSGIASCSADVSVSLEGSNVSSPGGTCTDVAGNVSAAVSATGLRIDRTPPSVSALRFPFANASGWVNEAVTVSFTGSDALSGVAGCSGPVVLSLDGANQSVGGSCTDRAGNLGSTLLTGISIDRTAPTATAVLARAPNAAGWYREAVTVSFAGTDSMSGSGLAGCSNSVTIGAEGRNQTATGTCLDRAGNQSLGAVATVNVDRTGPTINVVSPQDGTSVRQGDRLVAEYGCTDGLSGVFACGGTVPSGTVLSTGTAGTYTLTINATDAAGNTVLRTVRFTVLAAEEPGGAPGRLELDPLGSNYAREPLGSVAPSGLDAASFTAEAWVQVGLPQLQETDANGVSRGTMALMSDGAYDLRVLYDASSGTPLKVIGRVWYLDGSGTLTPRVLESTVEADRIVQGAWTHVSVGYEASSNTCFKSVNGQVTVYAPCLPAGRTPAREYDQLFGIGTTDAGSGTGMCAAQLGSDPQRRNALNGSVDEVRISRVVRYRAGFTPQGRLPLDADTLGLWRFDGAAGTTTFVNSVSGAVPLSGVASGARLAVLQPGGIGGG